MSAIRGRPRTELPGGLSAETHEVHRIMLGLSRRAYAEKIDMRQATYIKKVQHLSVPRKPHAQKSTAKVDFKKMVEEFLKLKPQYLKALKADLVEAERRVLEAKVSVRELRRLIAKIG